MPRWREGAFEFYIIIIVKKIYKIIKNDISDYNKTMRGLFLDKNKRGGGELTTMTKRKEHYSTIKVSRIVKKTLLIK